MSELFDSYEEDFTKNCDLAKKALDACNSTSPIGWYCYSETTYDSILQMTELRSLKRCSSISRKHLDA